MRFLFDCLLSVAVSIDCLTIAFTLSTLSKKQKQWFVFLVAGCHFIFPYLGSIFMPLFSDKLVGSIDVMSGTIFLSLGLYNLFNSFSEETEGFINQSIVVLAIMVSLDSLLIGLAVYDNTVRLSLMFSLMSMLFSFLGFYIGMKVEKLLGRLFQLLRGIIFTCFGLVVLFM